jgi:hypothetical protein
VDLIFDRLKKFRFGEDIASGSEEKELQNRHDIS